GRGTARPVRGDRSRGRPGAAARARRRGDGRPAAGARSPPGVRGRRPARHPLGEPGERRAADDRRAREPPGRHSLLIRALSREVTASRVRLRGLAVAVVLPPRRARAAERSEGASVTGTRRTAWRLWVAIFGVLLL